MELGLNIPGDGICQALQHPAAGAIDQDEIIRERSDILDIKYQDIFAFFLFKKICNISC